MKPPYIAGEAGLEVLVITGVNGSLSVPHPDDPEHKRGRLTVRDAPQPLLWFHWPWSLPADPDSHTLLSLN